MGIIPFPLHFQAAVGNCWVEWESSDDDGHLSAEAPVPAVRWRGGLGRALRGCHPKDMGILGRRHAAGLRTKQMDSCAVSCGFKAHSCNFFNNLICLLVTGLLTAVNSL